MASIHLPVLTDRVVELLAPAAPGLIIDVTVGLGGHAEALLRAEAGFRLVGLDRDPQALARADERLRVFGGRVRLAEETFDNLPSVIEELELEPPSAILADLGYSSLQIDDPERGFSFQSDGPLDMRMGSGGPTAAELLERMDWEELVSILRNYGEERRAAAIARAIIKRREESPLQTTGQLSRLVREVIGDRGARIHPATRTFQALRIAVNDELGQLERFLEPAVKELRPGGRIAVISFHSLEDRIVKHTLRRLTGRCTCPPDFPVCRCNPQRVAKVLTTSPERPDETEVAGNPRARSARLRVAEMWGVLMMDLQGLGPSNRFLIPQRDRRWPQVLSLLLMVSGLVVLALGLVGWPRLRSTSIHYELIRLREQVSELEQRERRLVLELEKERSPERLAARARDLGLVPAAPAGLPARPATEVTP